MSRVVLVVFFFGGGARETWLIGNKNSVCQKRSQKIFQRFCHRGPTYEQSLTLHEECQWHRALVTATNGERLQLLTRDCTVSSAHARENCSSPSYFSKSAYVTDSTMVKTWIIFNARS